MEIKVITIFEGSVYPVGTGSSAVTIPVKIKKNYDISDGDTLGIAIFKIIKLTDEKEGYSLDRKEVERLKEKEELNHSQTEVEKPKFSIN